MLWTYLKEYVNGNPPKYISIVELYKKGYVIIELDLDNIYINNVYRNTNPGIDPYD